MAQKSNPKAKPKAAAAAGGAPKSKGPELKAKGKEAKKALELEETQLDPTLAQQAQEDAEELEEELAAASSRSTDSNAAALAAASNPSDMSASFKNFRHHPDMENFYRFIYENDLRPEALQILNAMREDKLAGKVLKKPLKNGVHKS